MKKKTKQILTLNNVTDQNLKFVNINEGNVATKGLTCQVQLDPNNILSLSAEISLNGAPVTNGDFWQQIIHLQSSFLSPAKIVVKEALSKPQISAELSVIDEDMLITGYSVLKEGILFGADLVHSVFSGSHISAAKKKKELKKQAVPTEEITKIIEQGLNGNHEYSEKNDQWIVTVNTDNFFQRIYILLDSQAQVLKVTANFFRVSAKQELNLLAIILFLLHSTARLRFVRGSIISNGFQKTVGLEVVIPLILVKSHNLKKAIESVILGISFLQRPCKALLNETVAAAYLYDIWGISEVNH